MVEQEIPTTAPEAAQVSDHSERKPETRPESLKERWTKVGLDRQIELYLAIGLLATSLAYAIVASLQLCTMNDALNATNQLVAKTQEQVDAANRQAAAAEQSAAAARDSANAAQDSNGRTERAMRTTYRAHLLIQPPPLRRPALTAKGLHAWKVAYMNEGRGPATQVWHFTEVAVTKSRPEQLFPRGESETFTKQAIPIYAPVPPGGTGSFGLEGPLESMVIPMRRSILVEKELLTIQVVLYYRDEFDDPHESSRCITYESERMASFCSKGNYDD